MIHVRETSDEALNDALWSPSGHTATPYSIVRLARYALGTQFCF